MVIREFNNQDIEKIKEISYKYVSKCCYRVSKKGWSYDLKEESLQEPIQKSYSLHLMDEEGIDSNVFVIEEGENIIGYIEMVYDQLRQLLRILNLCVRQDHQQRGIGRKLVKAAKGFARFNKARGILLEVENGNFPAIQFFMKEGFRFCGVNDALYCNDGISENHVALYFVFEFGKNEMIFKG